jgi:hypothetical protein
MPSGVHPSLESHSSIMPVSLGQKPLSRAPAKIQPVNLPKSKAVTAPTPKLKPVSLGKK